MRFIRSSILVMIWIAAGCGGDKPPGGASPVGGGPGGAPAGPGTREQGDSPRAEEAVRAPAGGGHRRDPGRRQRHDT